MASILKRVPRREAARVRRRIAHPHHQAGGAGGCSPPTPSPRRPTPPRRSSTSSSRSAAEDALEYARSRSSIIVMILLALVSFSYRQTIFAYPSGGGSYVVAKRQPRRDAGAGRRGVAADRLRAHRGGVDLGRRRARSPSAVGELRPAPGASSASVLILRPGAGQPAGAARSRAPCSPVPTYVYILALGAPDRLRPVPGLLRRPRGPGPGHRALQRLHRRQVLRRRPRWRHRLPVRRGRSRRAPSALTGVEAISNGVPAFKKPESKQRGQHAHRHGLRSSAATSSPSRSLAHHLKPTLSGGRDDPLPARRGRVRPRGRSCTGAAGLDHGHPEPGRQHRLRRLPPRRVDPGQGQLPAPPALQPGRPAGVLQRRHRPRRRRRPSSS